jgi:tetratricopeptide (TPR) repeat protein
MKRIVILTAALALLVAPAATAFSLPAGVSVSDEQIARFEGTWLGHDNPSPFGPMSFAMDFRWEEDGSLHSHSAMSRKTWVDLRFRKLDGGWVMEESASLANMGVQEYTLHPVRAAGDTLEWAYRENPWFLSVRTALDVDELYMLVLLRDEVHVEFRLPRVTGDMAATVRAELEESRQRSGEEDIAQLKAAGASGGGGPADDPAEVRNARVRVKAARDDASAHLQLARALAEIIESAPPGKVPGYAFEMLGAFQKAAELEPTSVEAHFGLAQYYLNAPPIAGGSLEEASQEAAVLVELESALGDIVLAQIEAKQGNTESALARIQRVVDENPDLEIAQQLYAGLTAARAKSNASAEPRAGSEK